MNNYNIRKLANNEFYLLIPLMKDCFGMDVNIEYFEWKFVKNPAGFVEGYIAVSDEGEIAAYYGVIPEIYIINGKPTTIYQSCDTMTHSKHRRKGLFQKLALHCYECLKNENKLLEKKNNYISICVILNSKEDYYKILEMTKNYKFKRLSVPSNLYMCPVVLYFSESVTGILQEMWSDMETYKHHKKNYELIEIEEIPSYIEGNKMGFFDLKNESLLEEKTTFTELFYSRINNKEEVERVLSILDKYPHDDLLRNIIKNYNPPYIFYVIEYFGKLQYRAISIEYFNENKRRLTRSRPLINIDEIKEFVDTYFAGSSMGFFDLKTESLILEKMGVSRMCCIRNYCRLFRAWNRRPSKYETAGQVPRASASIRRLLPRHKAENRMSDRGS